MARGPMRAELPDNGDISFQAADGGRKWEVYYKPKPEMVKRTRLEEPDRTVPSGKLLIAKADTTGGWIETYPLNASRVGHGLFGPKYDVLKTIRFENLSLSIGV